MPKSVRTNEQRRLTGLRLVFHYGELLKQAIGPHEEDFVDAIADILHAANAHGHNTKNLIDTALMHFMAEFEGKE